MNATKYTESSYPNAQSKIQHHIAHRFKCKLYHIFRHVHCFLHRPEKRPLFDIIFEFRALYLPMVAMLPRCL
jgi:hypothetical protein